MAENARNIAAEMYSSKAMLQQIINGADRVGTDDKVKRCLLTTMELIERLAMAVAELQEKSDGGTF